MNRMPSSEPPPASSEKPLPLFVTTRWSLVIRAAAAGDSVSAHDALEQLCRTYWYPLYAYARRRGCSPHDAEDAAQEFFARLLAGDWLARADRERGRFRSFLLASFQYFLAGERERAAAQKRGGGDAAISIDDAAESLYRLEPADRTTPETLFERGWALALLRDVLARLEAEFDDAGRREWFDALRPALTEDRTEIRHAAIAERLGTSEAAARVAVHRLRRRYRELIREAVRSTVADPNDVEDEMHHLFRVLTGDIV